MSKRESTRVASQPRPAAFELQPLESRRMLSAAQFWHGVPRADSDPAPAAPKVTAKATASAKAGVVARAAAKAAAERVRAARGASTGGDVGDVDHRNSDGAAPDDFDSVHLTRAQVDRIIAQAASQALPGQVITVVDREGFVLGLYEVAGDQPGDDAPGELHLVKGVDERTNLRLKSLARARTAAYFQSTEDAFTTRTARFIVQDHFPHPVQNTSGGPLYGVQFSDFPGTDVLTPAQQFAVSGDPGGIPLYVNGVPVGGIGVSGDGHDISVRQDFVLRDPDTGSTQGVDPDNPDGEFYGQLEQNEDGRTGAREEHDDDEAVALAGAEGFMAPQEIQAENILVVGLRLPFTADDPKSDNPTVRRISQLPAGTGALVADRGISADIFNATPGLPRGSIVDSAAADQAVIPFPEVTISGVRGQLKNPNPAAASRPNGATSDPFFQRFGILSNRHKPGVPFLTTRDVKNIFTNAVDQALATRAAIRQPIGTPVRVHIAVVDTNGDVLGVFRMNDGTIFSYDVAVQKARTALFFSDDAHALTPDAIGFMAQPFFPPGINRKSDEPGPLYHLQNDLFGRDPSTNQIDLARVKFSAKNGPNQLRNGITIFPGGAPLYKDGHLVGAIGISGDGVTQDDLAAYGGTKGYRPPEGIRADQLGDDSLVPFLSQKADQLRTQYGISANIYNFIKNRLAEDALNDVQLPYLKFPRNSRI